MSKRTGCTFRFGLSLYRIVRDTDDNGLPHLECIIDLLLEE